MKKALKSEKARIRSETKWDKGCGRVYPQIHSKSIPSHWDAEGRRLESPLDRSATDNSPISSKLVPFSKLGKIMSAKGEGWATAFICCAQDTVVLYHPLILR